MTGELAVAIVLIAVGFVMLIVLLVVAADLMRSVYVGMTGKLTVPDPARVILSGYLAFGLMSFIICALIAGFCTVSVVGSLIAGFGTGDSADIFGPVDSYTHFGWMVMLTVTCALAAIVLPIVSAILALRAQYSGMAFRLRRSEIAK